MAEPVSKDRKRGGIRSTDISVIPSTKALGAFLKSLRRRIDRNSGYLGNYHRLKARRGLLVSQEELAEAVDVSRGWYSLLESGAKIRASTRLLARIAEALMLSAEERVELFRLALPEVAQTGFPELESTAPRRRAIEMLDAFRSLRTLSKTLWTASNELEALTLAREHAAEQFDPDFLFTTTWAGPAMWEAPLSLGRRRACQRTLRYYEFTCARTDARQRDQLFFTYAVSEPGDFVTNATAPSGGSFAELFASVSDYVGWNELDFLATRMRSKRGLLATMALGYEQSRGYADVECEYISTIAQLVSHAMSG